MAFVLYLEKTHHLSHCSQTFRSFPFSGASGSWCVVKSVKWSSGSDHSKIKVHISTNRSVRNIDDTEHHIITSTHRSKFSCQVRGCDLVVRMRAIVHVQLFRRAAPPSPHITGESLLFQLWPFAVVCCSCSCTFSIDCSENASAELGGNARYQAHSAPFDH